MKAPMNLEGSYRTPYRHTQAVNLDACGAARDIAENLGTAALPLPASISPVLVQIARYAAAALWAALRPINAAVEACEPRPPSGPHPLPA